MSVLVAKDNYKWGELQEEEEKKKKQQQKEEAARAILGVPSFGTALGGAGLNFIGVNKARKSLNDYAFSFLEDELSGNFDQDAANAAEQLVAKNGIQFLDSAALAPMSMNSDHPIMLDAFNRLPENEKINILIRGGNLSPFAISKEDIIWRGLANKVSAGTMAHEFGHVLNARARKGTWTEKIQPFLYRMGYTAPTAATAALSAAGLLGASDKTLLYGGLLGTATGLPQLYEELKASYKGAKFLKENGIEDDTSSTYSGIPTYLIPPLMPLLTFLTRKAVRAIMPKKKKDKLEKTAAAILRGSLSALGRNTSKLMPLTRRAAPLTHINLPKTTNILDDLLKVKALSLPDKSKIVDLLKDKLQSAGHVVSESKILKKLVNLQNKKKLQTNFANALNKTNPFTSNNIGARAIAQASDDAYANYLKARHLFS